MLRWLGINGFESHRIRKVVVQSSIANLGVLLAEELQRKRGTKEQIDEDNLIETSVRLGSILAARLVEKKIL